MVRLSYILILSLFLMETGCRNDRTAVIAPPEDQDFKPTGGMQDLVYNPIRADGTIDSSYLPMILWKEDDYDFGTIFEGDIVTKDFAFTNTGTAPLLIIKATSTCGCTIPEWPKKPVQPDSTAFIRVKFNSLHKQGGQRKTVTIFANTLPNTTTVTIHGKVEPKK